MTLHETIGRWTAGALSICLVSASAWGGCDQLRGPANPESRYIISEDGWQVHDSKTNLTWMRCSYGQTLSPDKKRCLGEAKAIGLIPNPNLNLYEFWIPPEPYYSLGWQRPDTRVLKTLVDANCRYPAINPVVFPDTPPAVFWGGEFSSHNSHGHDFYKYINFGDGGCCGSNEQWVAHYQRFYREGK